jgi:arginyl-tRNA synthetase
VTTADVVELPHADREARLPGGGTCTAAELAAAVGRDTARFVLLRARPGSRPMLDLAALSTATEANPAFRVQHAHARLCALSRHATALGIDAALGIDTELGTNTALGIDPVPGPLEHPGELELRDLVAAYVSVAAREEPYPLARHLESVAEAFARVEVCAPALPMGDDPVTDLHRARVALSADARAILADGLRRLDISAPERT